jgi:hypothetical protein
MTFPEAETSIRPYPRSTFTLECREGNAALIQRTGPSAIFHIKNTDHLVPHKYSNKTHVIPWRECGKRCKWAKVAEDPGRLPDQPLVVEHEQPGSLQHSP